MSGWNTERNRSNNAVEAEEKGLLKKSECDIKHLLNILGNEILDLWDLKQEYGEDNIDNIYFYLQDINDGILHKRPNISKYFSFSEWHHIDCGGFVKEIDYYSFDAESYYLNEVQKNYTAEIKAECNKIREQRKAQEKKEEEERKKRVEEEEQKRLKYIDLIVNNSEKLSYWLSNKGNKFFDWKEASKTNECFTENKEKLQKILTNGWMYNLKVVKDICKVYGFIQEKKPKKKAIKEKGFCL